MIATLIVARPSAAQTPKVALHPVVEFLAIDDDSARVGPPMVEDCGYYVRIRGTAGHSGGFRLGAAVQRRSDSLTVRIDTYRTSDLDPRDWQLARWTLRIGGLEPRAYQVEVLSGRDRLVQVVRLGAGGKNCSV